MTQQGECHGGREREKAEGTREKGKGTKEKAKGKREKARAQGKWQNGKG
jgi:hypothetical protein